MPFSAMPFNEDKSLGKPISVESLNALIKQAEKMKESEERDNLIMRISKENAILQAAWKQHGGMVHCL